MRAQELRWATRCVCVCTKESESPWVGDISVFEKRKRKGYPIDRNVMNRVREREPQRGLCVGALLNQPCNAGFYRRASLGSCDKWQASLICTWKTVSKKVERKRQRGEKVRKEWNAEMRVEDQCGVFKEINFSTSWGAVCAVLLMMRGKGRRDRMTKDLYLSIRVLSGPCDGLHGWNTRNNKRSFKSPK